MNEPFPEEETSAAKWQWMIEWCTKAGISPTNPGVWTRAQKAWEEMTEARIEELEHALRDARSYIRVQEEHVEELEDFLAQSSLTSDDRAMTTPQLQPEERSEELTEIGHFCALPLVPERSFSADVSLERQAIILITEKRWVNGTKLKYYFWPSGHQWYGEEVQKDIVRQGFKVWEDVGIGISFEETTNINESQVRIGFRHGEGSWSYLGRDNIDIPGRQERTMNFGWDLTKDPRGTDTPVHEIGHLLGSPHSHQNPMGGIVWDEPNVYEYFGAPPNNWSRETTYYNVLRKLAPSSVEGSEWDPDSIMGYGFAGGLIKEPPQYRDGLRPRLGITQKDIEYMRIFYPPEQLEEELTPLVENESVCISLEPAQQRDFVIVPESTDKYTIGTFGKSDTIMVLFEDAGGELQLVTGDDDSGTNFNAKLQARLHAGKRYILKLRLYFNYDSGDTAVMLWK